jgi:hypothetical protein
MPLIEQVYEPRPPLHNGSFPPIPAITISPLWARFELHPAIRFAGYPVVVRVEFGPITGLAAMDRRGSGGAGGVAIGVVNKGPFQGPATNPPAKAEKRGKGHEKDDKEHRQPEDG